MPAKKKIKSPQRGTPEELNKNQLQFCYEYVANRFNGTQAAISSGYSEKTAESMASTLLSQPKVHKKVAELTQRHLKTLALKGEDVIRELVLLGFSNMSDFMNEDKSLKTFEEMGEMTKAINSIEVIPQALGEDRIKFKLYDKKAALDSLGKHLNLFNEKEDHPNVNINIDAKDIQSQSPADIQKYYSELLRGTKGS